MTALGCTLHGSAATQLRWGGSFILAMCTDFFLIAVVKKLLKSVNRNQRVVLSIWQAADDIDLINLLRLVTWHRPQIIHLKLVLSYDVASMFFELFW